MKSTSFTPLKPLARGRRVRGANLWLRIYLTRNPSGLSLEQAAAKLRVRVKTLEEWVGGREQVPLAKLPLIADLTKIDLGVILQHWITGQLPAHAQVVQRLTSHVLSEGEARLIKVSYGVQGWAGN